MTQLPALAISIMQPWSWLIVNGHKDIENRDWRSGYRGPVLIHAGKRMDLDAFGELMSLRHPVTGEPLPDDIDPNVMFECGGIVGVAEIIDCVDRHASPWFIGRYGFVFANARPLPFMPLKGALGLFQATYVPHGARDG